MANKEKLFSDFGTVSKQEWLDKVEKDLKGRAIEELNFQLEDMKVSPIAHANDLSTHNFPIFSSNKTSNDWLIGETIIVDDVKASNKLLLEILSEGINAPLIRIDSKLSDEDFALLLNGVEPLYISTHFDLSEYTPIEFLNQWATFLKTKGNIANDIKGSAQFKNATAQQIADGINYCTNNIVHFNSSRIDARTFCNGSNSVAQELAQTIYEANKLFAQLNERDLTKSSFQFLVAVDTSYFISIAKIRALKLLWANVLKSYGVEDIHDIYIDAYLAPHTQGDDPNTNMVRSTTQAMSAAIAGVDRITVAPSEVIAGEASAFARRIARNVQHILKMESYLDRVHDPAAGSYYIEQLTDKLAHKAWEYFQARAKEETAT